MNSFSWAAYCFPHQTLHNCQINILNKQMNCHALMHKEALFRKTICWDTHCNRRWQNTFWCREMTKNFHTSTEEQPTKHWFERFWNTVHDHLTRPSIRKNLVHILNLTNYTSSNITNLPVINVAVEHPQCKSHCKQPTTKQQKARIHKLTQLYWTVQHTDLNWDWQYSL